MNRYPGITIIRRLGLLVRNPEIVVWYADFYYECAGFEWKSKLGPLEISAVEV